MKMISMKQDEDNDDDDDDEEGQDGKERQSGDRLNRHENPHQDEQIEAKID